MTVPAAGQWKLIFPTWTAPPSRIAAGKVDGRDRLPTVGGIDIAAGSAADRPDSPARVPGAG